MLGVANARHDLEVCGLEGYDTVDCNTLRTTIILSCIYLHLRFALRNDADHKPHNIKSTH